MARPTTQTGAVHLFNAKAKPGSCERTKGTLPMFLNLALFTFVKFNIVYVTNWMFYLNPANNCSPMQFSDFKYL